MNQVRTCAPKQGRGAPRFVIHSILNGEFNCLISQQVALSGLLFEVQLGQGSRTWTGSVCLRIFEPKFGESGAKGEVGSRRTRWRANGPRSGIQWSTKGPEVYIQGPPRVLAGVGHCGALWGQCGRLAGMGAGVTVECELRVCLGRVFGTRFRLRKEAGPLAATFWLWMARPGTRFRLRKEAEPRVLVFDGCMWVNLKKFRLRNELFKQDRTFLL